MSSNAGRVNRPYRKASEYLHSAQRTAAPSGMLPHTNQAIEALQQEIVMLKRKIEHSEAEYEQSREYWDNQLDLAHDRELKIGDQCKRLQSNYNALQTANRELEARLFKVNRIEVERDMLVNEINELNNKLTEAKNSLFKAQEENERLRKDCNLAVQLLKCNQSSYQVKRIEQLPASIQKQVSEYKVGLQNYNEYINPYVDGCSDSDSESGLPASNAAQHNTAQPRQKQTQKNEVPVEFLAEALKKSENVHMNLEASDYIKDPTLHSAYKAHYTERKLIKPNYDQESPDVLPKEKKLDVAKFNTNSSAQQPIKQEAAPVETAESSPWELAPTRTVIPRQDDDLDDESPAGAYGAYAVGPKRRIRKTTTEPQTYETYTRSPRRSPYKPQNKSVVTEAQANTVRASKTPELPIRESSNFNLKKSQDAGLDAVYRSPSLDDLNFRAPASSKTSIPDFSNRSGKSSSSVSSSTSSSKKSTPLKVRGKEKATSSEVSSLLDQAASDDENDLQIEVTHHPQSLHSSPIKSYLKNERSVGAEGSSLLAPVEYEQEEAAPACEPIDLEWEVEIPLPTEEVQQAAGVEDLIDHAQALTVHQEPVNQEPELDLLLSYTNEESPAKSSQTVEEVETSHVIDLEDLIITPEHLRRSDNGVTSLFVDGQLPPPHPTGELLSEILTNNPSLGSFLMTPPPPQQFSSMGDVSDVSSSDPTFQNQNPILLGRPCLAYSFGQPRANVVHVTADVSAAENIQAPVRVDDQIEVVDLDEEPRKRDHGHRRGSLGQAQEYGNVMNM